MNIDLLRAEYDLNKECIDKLRVYLSPTGVSKDGGQEFYKGYFCVAGYPLYTLSASKALLERAWKNKDGTLILDEATGMPKMSEIGDLVVTFTSQIGEVEEDVKNYGKLEEKLIKNGEKAGQMFTSAKLNGFTVNLLGETLFKLDLQGRANDKNCLSFSFDNYRLESYEHNEALLEERGSTHKPAVLKSIFEPAKSGWNWDDLIEFTKALLTPESEAEFKEFMKASFPSSTYEKVQVKLNPAAQAILDKVKSRSKAKPAVKPTITEEELPF